MNIEILIVFIFLIAIGFLIKFVFDKRKRKNDFNGIWFELQEKSLVYKWIDVEYGNSEIIPEFLCILKNENGFTLYLSRKYIAFYKDYESAFLVYNKISNLSGLIDFYKIKKIISENENN